jgi:hypothetical protein
MRAFLLLLLLANLAFFTWAHYWVPQNPGSDPRPLGRQIDPQKLPIVAPPAKAGPASSAAGPAQASGACVEWGSFTPDNVAAAKKLLQPLALGDLLSEQKVRETANWWVFMPPQGNQKGAQHKASELDALGVNDFHIVSDEGAYRWAISLGAFRSEAGAQAHLAALQAKGVRSAQVGPRVSEVQKVWLRVRGVDAGLRERLKAFAKAIEGSELRGCG